MLLFFLAVAVLSCLIVWFGSSWLDSSSQKIGEYLNLPQIVQGAVIAAVGSSAPELASTILSTARHGEFVLGVSAIVGSAIFNILVIPGLSALYSPGRGIEVSKDVVTKDGLFYTLAVAVMLLTFYFAFAYHPVDTSHTKLIGTVTRGLAMGPFLLYFLYLFLHQQDVAEEGRKHTAEEFRAAKSQINIVREVSLFLFSIALVIVSVEGLVWSGIEIGNLLHIPSFIWGLTVIAAATSLPDTKISVVAAQNGLGDRSLANVLGSNIFDLCFCIPCGVFVAGTATINLAQAMPMMSILVFATLVIFVYSRTGLILAKWEGFVCLVLYGLFVTFVIGETLGATRFLMVT
jgi:cation:H+ antiporter